MVLPPIEHLSCLSEGLSPDHATVPLIEWRCSNLSVAQPMVSFHLQRLSNVPGWSEKGPTVLALRPKISSISMCSSESLPKPSGSEELTVHVNRLQEVFASEKHILYCFWVGNEQLILGWNNMHKSISQLRMPSELVMVTPSHSIIPSERS
jgi:hypothetical protein